MASHKLPVHNLDALCETILSQFANQQKVTLVATANTERVEFWLHSPNSVSPVIQRGGYMKYLQVVNFTTYAETSFAAPFTTDQYATLRFYDRCVTLLW